MPPFALFELTCRECSGDIFDVREGVNKYGAIGVRALCLRCGRERDVFNAKTDGYDGAHGHNDFLGLSVSWEPLRTETGTEVKGVQLRAGCVYNNPLIEMIQDASKLGTKPQNLFDWFHLLSRTAGAPGWEWVWEFECA